MGYPKKKGGPLPENSKKNYMFPKLNFKFIWCVVITILENTHRPNIGANCNAFINFIRTGLKKL